jgi:hypothetical protein
LNRVGLQITGRPISETWSHTEFSRYIIFYSLIKIHARLTHICIPGTNVKLLDVLANIAEDTIVAHNEPLPVHKFDQNSEEMLADEIGIGYEQMTRVSANVVHIGSDAQSQRLVWRYFTASLQHLQLLGSKLVSYRRRPSPNHDQVNLAHENLAMYTELLVILDWLLRCPAVWRVCRNPTVAVAIAKARQDYHVRTQFLHTRHDQLTVPSCGWSQGMVNQKTYSTLKMTWMILKSRSSTWSEIGQSYWFSGHVLLMISMVPHLSGEPSGIEPCHLWRSTMIGR